MRFFRLTSILAVLAVAGCSGLWGDDEFDRYFQHTDRITLSAGNAKEVNAAAHMLTPWPPGVGDRRIAADGARMQRAIERYHRGARPPDPLPDINIGGTPLGTALPTEPPVSGAGAAPGGAAPASGAGGAGTGLTRQPTLQGQ
jgi:hypothetical protein